MFSKYLILIIFTLIGGSIELNDINFANQIENLKNSIDKLKFRVDILSERNLNDNYDNKFSLIMENFDVIKNSINSLNTYLNVKSDCGNFKNQDANRRLDNLQFQQRILTQQLTDMIEKNSLLLNVTNTLKESNEILLQKYSDLEVKYLDFIKNNENKTKLFFNQLKTISDTEKMHTDINFEIIHCLSQKMDDKENLSKSCVALENFYKKPLFDARTDKLPALISCQEDPKPIDCKAATKCTQKSGYYKIFINVNEEDKEILVFCDAKTDGGGWLNILRRKDGSVNFTRSWSDYVNGFGQIETEYWLGLDNIHALTNNNGRQELYVYIENWEGESRYARYDNFIVLGANDEYLLKSLGNYSGTAGDSMWFNVGRKFSTIDRDNDQFDLIDCANDFKSGWWFSICTQVLPTGLYLDNVEEGEGMSWRDFGGLLYSHKIMNLMIRSL